MDQTAPQLLPPEQTNSLPGLSWSVGGGLLAIALAWFAFCCWVSWQRWVAWDIGIDSAVWTQVLHNAVAGNGWAFTCYTDLDHLVQRPIWSMHFYLLLWPLAAIYRWWAHPLTLYVIMHLAHAAGALMVGILAWRGSRGDARWAWIAAVVFCLAPAHARGQLAYDFSCRHLALFWLPAIGVLAGGREPRWALLPLLGLAASEENLAIIALFSSLGLAMHLPAHRRFFGGVAACLLVYTLVVLTFGLSSFLPPGIKMHILGRYAHLREGPVAILSSLLTLENAGYLAILLAPWLTMSFWRLSWWLLPLIPAALQNLLCPWPDVRLIGHHYTTPLAVLLALAAVERGSTLSMKPRRWLGGGMLLVSILLGMSWFPTLPYAWEGIDLRARELGANLAPLSERIPPDASLSAPPAVCAHLSQRTWLGFFPFGVDQVDFVVVPKYLPGYPLLTGEEIGRWLKRLGSDPAWRLDFQNDDVSLFKRVQPLKPVR